MDDQKNEGGGAARMGALVIVAVLAVLYFGYAFADKPPFWSIDAANNANFTILYCFLEKVFYLCVAALVALAAAGAGYSVLRAIGLGDLPLVEATAASLGLGLGALSLVTLGLGSIGIPVLRAAAAPVLVAFILAGLPSIRLWLRRLESRKIEPWTLLEKAFGAAAAAAGVLTIVYAFNPPMDFDVLEYHLGAPAYWFGHGAIAYIQHNAYSNFPSNAEMLYLFSMALTGSKLTGAIVGKVLIAYAALAAAGAAYALARWMLSRAAGIFSAAALLTAGGFFHVATAGYVEPLQVLYTLLAVLAAGRFISQGAMGALALSAIMTGLAMCVKYTSAPFLAVPLAFAMLLRRGAAVRRLLYAVSFTAISTAVVAPWLVKNLILTGNPFYPLLYGVFGGRDWSALQDARWQFAHTPKGGLAWEQWARHVLGTFFSNEMVPLASFAFAPLVLLARAARKRALFALGMALLYVFGWFALTHRIDRFLLPAVAVLAAVSGVGLFSLPRGAMRAVVMTLAVAMAILGVFYLGGVYGAANGLDPSVPLFGNYAKFLNDKLPGYQAWTEVNAIVPKGARVLLVGESQTFYLDADCVGGTVFDRNLLDEIVSKAGGTSGAVADAIKAAGIGYIFVNWPEVSRLQATYRFTFEGREHGGYSDLVDPSLFEAMASAGRIKAVYSSGAQIEKDARPDMRAYMLYSVE